MFDLASHPMTALNSAIMSTLDGAGIHEGFIEQNAADAVLIFKPVGRVTSGAAILAVHALLAEKGVAVVSTDMDRAGMIRIVFARASDGTIGAPVKKGVHDAVLEDWFLGHDGASSVIYGIISSDSKGRWPDGTMIATSPLQNGTFTKEGLIVHTLRTAYLLGRPRQDSDISDMERLGTLLVGYPALAMQVRN